LCGGNVVYNVSNVIAYTFNAVLKNCMLPFLT